MSDCTAGAWPLRKRVAAGDGDVDLATAVGRRIGALRERRSLSQATLARLSGVPASSISQVERGHRLPSLPSLLAIVRVLRCSADELLGHDLQGDAT